MALKEKALRRLADKLNAAGITWAAGGDWMLCQRGIADVYHGFDIVVTEADLAAADKALSRLGMKTEDPAAPNFHCDYHFDGADISLRTPWAPGGHAMCFDAASAAETAAVLGASVHLMYAEDWYVLAALSGDTRTAQRLEAWFTAHGAAHPERFEQVVSDPLPEELRAVISIFPEVKQA